MNRLTVVKRCTGCDKEIWWFGELPPICAECADDPAPIIATLRARLAAAEAALENMKVLASFAQHHPNCPNKWSRSCDCGYWDAYKAAKPHIAALAARAETEER